MSKKLYIYDYIDDLTSNYHSGGGLLIITGGDPQEAIDADRKRAYAQYNDEPFLTKLPEPTRIVEVSDTEEDIVIEFPDTGCC